MKFFFIIFLLFAGNAFTISLSAHENWLEVIPVVNEKSVEVRINNGHNFPKSRLSLNDDVISYCKIYTPEKKYIELKTKKEKLFRKGSYKIKDKGCYSAISGLKNPPRYFLKSLFYIGNCSKNNIKLGEEFEIVVVNYSSSAKKGDVLKIKVYFKGKPVQVPLSISINGNTNWRTSTDRKGFFKLKLVKSGKYLITSYHKGKGTSLTFKI
jgi:uncharacterized GH25 family protein